MEEWIEIEEFPGYYVSSLGQIQRHDGRMMTKTHIQYNMPTVGLKKPDGDLIYRRSVGTIVAKAFLPEPERFDFNTIIYLDGDRVNVSADNLMWRPRWFAVAYHKERGTERFPDWDSDIRLIDTGEEFEHINEPAVKYGLLETAIYQSLLKDEPVFPYGYVFRYAQL